MVAAAAAGWTKRVDKEGVNEEENTIFVGLVELGAREGLEEEAGA